MRMIDQKIGQNPSVAEIVSSQQKRLESDYQTIMGLAGEYDALHLVNLETDEYIPYYVESDNSFEAYPIMADYNDFFSAHKAFVEEYCHPDFKERMMRFADKEFIRKTLQGRKRYFCNVQVKNPVGIYIWIQFVLIKFDSASADAVKIAVGYIDVNEETLAQNAEREKAVAIERQYNNVISALASDYQNIIEVDLKKNSLVVYRQSERISSIFGDAMGAMSFDDAVDAYVRYAVSPQDKEQVKEALSTGVVRKELAKFPFYTKIFLNNENHYTELKVVRTDNADKVIAGFGVKDEAIREEKRQKAALEQAERDIEEARRAQQAQEERYNFLVNVAHELRTPLTLIIGPLKSTLRRGTLSEKDSGTVVRVCQQADRMTNLLNTVLTTNKLERGADSMRAEPVEFNKWVASCAEEFKDEAENHNMAVLVNLDPAIGMVDMDTHLCKIVFSNIMINALHHNFPDSPITVTTSCSQDGSAVRISVTDKGSGIGDIDVSNLFKRYYRATEDKTGFGIGLAYSKAIVDAHHGTMGAYNNSDNCGATFWFELPVKVAEN